MATEGEVNRLEKAAWDANVEHALVALRAERDALRRQVERLRDIVQEFADGSIDVSHTAVILGYPETESALERARAALSTPSQMKCCGSPAPDRSGRSCDKPLGHDGEHWTYGGNTATWTPSQTETEHG